MVGKRVRDEEVTRQRGGFHLLSPKHGENLGVRPPRPPVRARTQPRHVNGVEDRSDQLHPTGNEGEPSFEP